MKTFVSIFMSILLSLEIEAQIIITKDSLIDKDGVYVIKNDPNKNNKLILNQFSFNQELRLTCGFTSAIHKINITKLNEYLNERLLMFDGDFVTFNSLGDTAKIVHYNMGNKYGKQKTFTDKGILEDELNILDTVNATYTLYYPNGKPKMIFQLVNNQKEGKEQYFYENGTLKALINNYTSLWDGDFITFKPDGSEDSKFIFSRGTLLGQKQKFELLNHQMELKKSFYTRIAELYKNSEIIEFFKNNSITISFIVLPSGKVSQLTISKIPENISTPILAMFKDSAFIEPETFLGEKVNTKVDLSLDAMDTVVLEILKEEFKANLNNHAYQPRYSISSISNKIVYTFVDQLPEFPGGIGEMYSFISNRMHYPEEAQKNGIQGRIFVQFTVTKTGKLKDIDIQRSIHPALDAEAIRVFSIMPDWKPGTLKNIPVNVQMSVPLNFILN